MGELCFFKYNIFKAFLLINILLFKHARSDDYTIGDDEGWTSQTNFDAWSRKYNFTTGDVLVFKYVKGEHNVYEVEESTFRSCNASSGVIAKYESGNDEVELRQAKKYWFICNVDGHCLGGMRFAIDVKEANNTNNSTTSSGGELPPPPNPSNSSTSSYAYGRYWCFFILLVSLFGVLL